MVGMYSVHSNHREDRRFQYLYRSWGYGMLRRNRWWSSWSSWDAKIHVARSNAVMVNLWSYHNNHREDRRFRPQWQLINHWAYRSPRKLAYWTKPNYWDGKQSQYCKSGYWQMGLYSIHNNQREDRRFWLYCRQITDINECRRNPCKSRGRCYNRLGSYTCYCYRGYKATRWSRSCRKA